MNIHFKPFQESDLKKAFQLYEQELKSVIDDAFGWEEAFQVQRFSSRYTLDCFYWIKTAGNVVGYVYYELRKDNLHVSLLIIEKPFQRKKLGKVVMEVLMETARTKKLKISLSCFKNNHNALTFYKKLGFRVKSQDESFYDLDFDAEV